MKNKDDTGFIKIEIEEMEDTVTRRMFELVFITSLIFICMIILYIIGVIP